MTEQNIWYIRIMKLKDEYGYTMKDLVNGIGVNESTINGWKFKEMKSKNIIAVAKFFHVSTDFIIGLSENRTISDRYPGVVENHLKLLCYIELLNLSEEQYNRINKIIELFLKFGDNATD